MATQKISCRIDGTKLARLKQAYPGLNMTGIINTLVDNALTKDNQLATLVDTPIGGRDSPVVKEDRFLQAWRYMNSSES
jgi:hypothetical protein